MIIYVDVLIFTNIIINYCILSLSQKFLHIKTKQTRLVISSTIGALFSLIVFLPIYSNIFSLSLKLLVAFIMCLIGFSYSNISSFIKLVVCVFSISLVFSGLMVLIYQYTNIKRIAVINDVVYFQIEPLNLILISLFIYLIIIVLQRSFNDNTKNTLVTTKILYNQITYECCGKVDTGNSVVEPFSQIPVIIVEKSVFGKNEIPTTRIIPYKALGSHGILNGFKPDKVFISKKEIKKNIYIGIYNGNIDTNVKAIINSEIVR